MSFPSGTYYIGDLGYVLTDPQWDEVCELTHLGNWREEKEGLFMLKSGILFSLFTTKHGDGIYKDQEDRTYVVDSATIGCIPVHAISTITQKGHVVTLDKSFTPYKHNSLLHFGTICIDTE